ncbi:UPF0102 protein [Spirochaetia bacterium]|nr:UPF0102 protein [Spirochaetia bacterium]
MCEGVPRGRKGEEQAAEFLVGAGMKIIAKNFRSRSGEIDLVALDGEIIVFIEVKTWSVYSLEDIRYSVDAKKQRRIIETAKYFLSLHREYNNMAVRFDVVFIARSDQCNQGGISHFASAFTEEQ